MFASLSMYQFPVSKIDEAVQVWHDFQPLFLKMKGFQHGYFLADRASGKVLIVGHWDSEADARAVEHDAVIQKAASPLRDLSLVPPIREYYVVGGAV